MFGLTDILNFGKYRGRCLQTIIREDPQYIDWARNNISYFELDDEAEEELYEYLAESENNPFE